MGLLVDAGMRGSLEDAWACKGMLGWWGLLGGSGMWEELLGDREGLLGNYGMLGVTRGWWDVGVLLGDMGVAREVSDEDLLGAGRGSVGDVGAGYRIGP